MSMEFVMLHINECRNSTHKTKAIPCGKLPVAIAIDSDLPPEDCFYPICLDCIYKHRVPQSDLLPLSQFIGYDVDVKKRIK